MNRLFSVTRRRPHIVDLSTPVVAGVDGYRLKWAANFDGVFAAIITSTNVGFLDSNVNRNVLETQPTTGTYVRIVFDPTTYSIPDASSFWLQFFPITGGLEGTPGAPTLVLPDAARHGVGIVTIHGTAPNAASSAGSLQLDLPMLMQDFKVHNESGAKDLFIATEAGGAEILIPKASTDVQSLGFLGTQGTLYVRGDNATVVFSASFTLAFPR